ncbi:MAG: glycosyltransferase family 1 protein [Planctomycetes bacterium]|nr:glycosyltransferase family 1 protein [Planctomycetota bacterium]
MPNTIATDPESLPKFEKLGLAKKIMRSQWACNPFDYQPGNQRKDIDVCFIGLPYGNRPAYLNHIRDHGISTQVFGSGWSDRGEIGFPTMIGLLQRSKLALNFSRASQGNRNQIKARYFEIPACGAFMLTEPAEGMDAYLTLGRHYDTFESPTELLEKIRYWLDRKDRDALALEASAIIRSSHIYSSRLEEIFECIGLYDRPA